MDHDQDKECPSDPSPPSVIVCRPKLIRRKKKSIFPIQLSEQDEKDQGRTCVSVILKTSETVPERVMRVEELSAKHDVRYQCKSSQRCGARLDFCFKSATEARQFFRRVNDMERRRSISVILTTEAGLGYQHLPALSEKELLNVQSPNYSRNIFKTSVRNIKVDVNSSDEVSFVFRTVADVNAFLFEVGNSKGLRTLGELKKNTRDLVLKPRQGQFVLFSEDDSSVLEGLREEFGFDLSTDCDGVSALKFEDKEKMFAFLLSQKGNNLQQLALDQSQIVSPGDDLRKMIVHECEENISKNPDSVKTEGKNGLAEMLAEKNKEIDGLNPELRAEDVERQINEPKKIESTIEGLKELIVAGDENNNIDPERRDLEVTEK